MINDTYKRCEKSDNNRFNQTVYLLFFFLFTVELKEHYNKQDAMNCNLFII